MIRRVFRSGKLLRLSVLIVLSLCVLAPLAAAPLSGASAPQQGNRLRVVTKPLEPFVFKQNGGWAGFSIDLWNQIAENLELTYDWVEVKSVTEQLQAVQNGDADVAIAGISMTPERDAVVDFSHPYFDAGLQVMVSPKSQRVFMSLLGTVFSPALLQVLGVGLLVLLVMAHIIWLVERGSSHEIPKAYLPGIWESSWWALSTVATLEYGNKEKPRSHFKRALAMLLVILGIVMIAQFTASVTASLTVEHLAGYVNGPSDLPGKTIATVSGSTAAKYLDGQHMSYTGVSRIEEAYALLNEGKVLAIVYDAPVLRYYAAGKGKGQARVVGPVFHPEAYGIALPSGSKWRKPINEALLRLKYNGTYDSIYSKWFGSE